MHSKLLTAFFCFLSSIVFYNCNTTASVSPVMTDTNRTTLSERIAADSNFYEPDQQALRKELIDSYLHPLVVDSFFNSAGINYKVQFKHFCLTDSSFNVPAQYNFDTHKSFTTHPFISELIITTETDTILNKKITSSIFHNLADESLKKYGTLFYPDFSIEGDSISIKYSYSIPVTDVGIAVGIVFNKEGRYSIRQ